MKKWKEPKVWNLSFEKTNECDCLGQPMPLDKDTEKNMHYCHDYQNKGLDGPWHQNNCTSLGVGHFQSGSRCDETHIHWSTSHKSNCCCAAS